VRLCAGLLRRKRLQRVLLHRCRGVRCVLRRRLRRLLRRGVRRLLQRGDLLRLIRR
jgi:hypothetical protein